MLALGRRAVRIDEEILVSVICRLEQCPGLDVHEAAGGHVLPLRRLAEVHRQRSGEDEERLFLERVPVTASPGAGLVAPDVRAGMDEAGRSLSSATWRGASSGIVPVKATGSKVSRAEAVSALFEAGKVLVPEQAPSWLGDWTEEHVAFPAGRHDDMVDTTGMALERFRSVKRSGGGIAGVVEHGPIPRGERTIEQELVDYERAKAARRAAREATRAREVAAFRDPRESIL